MATPIVKGTLLGELALHNGLGVSSNKRNIIGGAVKVNKVIVHDCQYRTHAGDIIEIGKRVKFTVS